MRDLTSVVVVGCTIFGAVLALGANRNDFAVLTAAVFGLEAVVLALTIRTGPSVDWRKCMIPGALFVVSFGFCALALTPYAPDGAHPVWSYVTAIPAAAIDRSAVVVGLVKLAGLACCVLVGFLLGSEDRRAHLLNKYIIFSGGIYAVWALVAHIITPTRVYGVFETMHAGRLTASLLSANSAGTLLGAVFAMSVTDLIARSRNANVGVVGMAWHLTFPALNCALLGLALLLTNSRGAFAATLFAVALAVFWARLDRDWLQNKPQRAFTTLVFILLAIVLVTASDIVLDRYTTAFQDWVAQRNVIYTAHWQAFLAAPWLGYGLGSFDELNKLLMNADNYSQLWNIRAAHSVFLQWLEEGGLLGAIPMFLAVASAIFLMVRGVAWRRSAKNKALLRGVVAASAVIIIHGWSDFGLQVPAIADLWGLLLGCGVAVAVTSYDPARSSGFEGGMRWTRSVPAATAMVIGALVFVFGGSAFASLSGLDGNTPRLLPIAAVYGKQADRLLGASSDIPVAVRARAAELTYHELSLDPASATGWLRLAYIRSLEQPANQSEISDLVEKSFLVAPLDPDVLEWRTRFCLEHWDRVSTAVRGDVLAQARISWSIWPQKMLLAKMPATIANPAGRLSIGMAIIGFQSEEQAANSAAGTADGD
jgi:O-antigen ligase